MSGVSEPSRGVENTTTSHDALLLSSATSQDFTNANTITKWLLSQPADARILVAQALFEKLLHDASKSRLHQDSGHACVRLCGFIQQCAKSSDEGLRQWAFAETISLRLFHFYLEWYEHDPLRALRLVLDFLSLSCTQNPSPETGHALREHILETLTAIITRKYPRLMIKSGLQCLDHLLSKQALQLDQLARKYRELEPALKDEPDLGLFRSLVLHLFSWMELSYVGPLAGKGIVHIFRGLEAQKSAGQASENTLEIWLSWIRDGLVRSPEILDDIKNYVLVPIFKTDKSSSLALARHFNQAQESSAPKSESTDQDFMLQLAVLELGKRFGLVEEPMSQAEIPEASDRIFLQEDALDSFLSRPSVSVRSSAFSLLVSSQATTKPYSETAFSLLKRHLAPFHTDYDARFRNEVLGLTKNLIRRIKSVITVAERSLAGSAESAASDRPAPKRKFGPEAALKDDAEANEIRIRHENFLSWYLDFLKGELLPTASYQRHITALRATLLAVKVGKYAGAADEFDKDVAKVIASDPSWTRLLFDLMLDPFDDVRDGACVLLGLLPQDLLVVPDKAKGGSMHLLEALKEFCGKAQALANRTGRADHGDGAARSQGLLCRWLSSQELRFELISKALGDLENKIVKAEGDLGHAAIENPVHGDFAAISYMWQVLASEKYSLEQLATLNEVYRRVLGCSKRIWVAVKHVLCDDSPEGHLPEEMEDIEGLDTKDLLSYSFRAVHESSNLMRLMVGTLRLEPGPGVPFPPLEVFRDVGYLTFEQLASLRHRGAFSTVSLTFTTCCQLTQKLPNVYADFSGADNLLREWYQGALTCIETQASTTRRSAGIPDLITAVLSANAETPSFDEVFNTLREIAEKPALVAETDGSNLPQVHALNCLRGVFRSSLLSKKAENYLAPNLQLASNSLKSEVWAIRNCGLLLLRSLIDCLLGTGESKATMESGWDGRSVRISYNKYPTLPGLMLHLLQSAGTTPAEGTSSAAAEAVFPALDIIRRAGPPDEHRDELRGYIEDYLGSRIWLLREIAARTLCSFFLQGEWTAAIIRLLDGCGASTNRLHGVLMTAKFVLERKIDLGYNILEDSTLLKSLLQRMFEQDQITLSSACPEIQATYLEIENLLVRHIPKEQLSAILPPTDAWDPPSETPKLIRPALLAMQASFRRAWTDNPLEIHNHVRRALHDSNTACRLLEALPEIWAPHHDVQTRWYFWALYADASKDDNPQVRAQALSNLTTHVDDLLARGEVNELPPSWMVEGLWKELQEGEINPTLSYAIIRATGTYMAVLRKVESPGLDKKLRNWGVMIANALDVDNSFDTRYSAALSLRSFLLSPQPLPASPPLAYLPFLSALYDSLVDDDDEVRDVAASAASGVLGTHFSPPVAASCLIDWMATHYSVQAEFHRLVISRVTGQPPSSYLTPDFTLAKAEDQLLEAMDFDDALFAAEEQNLFIDEVRETERWCRGLEGMEMDGEAGRKLEEWTLEGMKCLVGLVEEKEDGALGWTADQKVFAVCARVVMCAVKVGEKGGEVRELMGRFVEEGRKGRVHGGLLEMVAVGV